MPTAVQVSHLGNLNDLPRVLDSAADWSALRAALASGRGGVIDGAWGSSAALAAATLHLHCPSLLLIAIAHPRDVEAWCDDLTSFLGFAPVVFPAWDVLPNADSELDTIGIRRLKIFKSLSSREPPCVLLTTMQSLMQPVPDPNALACGRRIVKRSDIVEPDELGSWLVSVGYRREEVVVLPGTFARRGGIVDVFPPDADQPLRLEFFGDEVESIRSYSVETQRSLATLSEAELSAANLELPSEERIVTGHLCDYLPSQAWTLLVEPMELSEQSKVYRDRCSDPRGLFTAEGVFQQLQRFAHVSLFAFPASEGSDAICHLRVESVERFSGKVQQVREELDAVAASDRVIVACDTEAECQRLSDVLAAGQLAQSDRLKLALGRVKRGFRLRGLNDADGVVILGGHELFHREQTRTVMPRRRLESRAIDSFLDLEVGDLIVHVNHGIGRYRGMQMLEKNGQQEEHLVLEFAGATKLYVPSSKIDLVQKYIGGGKTDPELSKLTGTAWQKRKDRVAEAVVDLAAEMLQLQAVREAQHGLALPADSEWQSEFEAAFPYQETPDQLTTLAELKHDMQRPRPMDRLICGDVGFGKTELAIRAAFKTIDNGRQVAVLVPTTVLAEQHYRTFSDRLGEYPFVVEGLSRFRTAGEQRQILRRLSEGGVDVIIGTHRLLSADVRFKDLGLVVIDEEQRFGVEHKDRLKRLRATVDVLTMTATPIPRTLHLSLLGIRDISNLETPPADRMAVETRIAPWNSDLIKMAIHRELNREGQVYFVHNRVHDIHVVADRLKKIVPEARLVVGHGQMSADELEDAMLRFVQHECDILVSTTIIESGLDIPRANTIFIDEADIYGLADLHQLRGRVGRSAVRAYCYLLLDPRKAITPTATRRLKAIEEYTELGAGFKIALRDLEIRGAGNILGNEQSGHIAAVGYEMYCQLLENAVRQMKHQRVKTPLEVHVDLPWPAYLPHDYVPSQRQRIEVYRRLARVRKLERLTEFREELQDRFGALPEPAEWLMRMTEVRLLAARWQIGVVRLEKPSAGVFGPTDLVLEYKSPRLVKRLADQSGGRLRVVDQASAYCRLSGPEEAPLALHSMLISLLRTKEEEISESPSTLS
jgi:transcription-repair coupling factor (superfamily II helicase)